MNIFLWLLIGFILHLNNLRMIRNKVGYLDLFDLVITVYTTPMGPFGIILNLIIYYIHSDFDGKFFKK